MIHSNLSGRIRKKHCLSKLYILLVADRIDHIRKMLPVIKVLFQCSIDSNIRVILYFAKPVCFSVIYTSLQFSGFAPLSSLNPEHLCPVQISLRNSKQSACLAVSDSMPKCPEISFVIVIGQCTDSCHIILHPYSQLISTTMLLLHRHRLYRYFNLFLPSYQCQYHRTLSIFCNLGNQFLLCGNTCAIYLHDVIPCKQDMICRFFKYAIHCLHRTGIKNKHPVCGSIDSHHMSGSIQAFVSNNRYFHFLNRKKTKKITGYLIISCL